MPFFNHTSFITVAKEIGKIVAISTPAAICGAYIWGKIFQKAREKVVLKSILAPKNTLSNYNGRFIWPLSANPYKKTFDFIVSKIKEKKRNSTVNLTNSFLLIEGPIGVGKTMLAHEIRQEAGCVTYIITASTIFAPNIDQASIIKSLYEEIERHNKPSLIIFDEIDVLFNTYPVLAAQFTHFFNGKTHPLYKNFLIIATTNNRFSLHEAIRDRFSYKISLSFPTIPDLAHFIAEWVKQRGVTIDFWQTMQLLVDIKLLQQTMFQKVPVILEKNEEQKTELEELHKEDINRYAESNSSLQINNYRNIEVLLEQLKIEELTISHIRDIFLKATHLEAKQLTFSKIDLLWQELIMLQSKESNLLPLSKDKKIMKNQTNQKVA